MKEVVLSEAPNYKINEVGEIFNISRNRKLTYNNNHINLCTNGIYKKFNKKKLLEKYFNNTAIENLEGEIWKGILGYEGLYEVSNLGRIKSLSKINTGLKKYSSTDRLSYSTINQQNGYCIIGLRKDNKCKTYLLHRIVAIAFIQNYTPNIKIQVNHINGIKDDNRASNLEWVTNRENTMHAFRIGLIPTKKDRSLYVI